MSYCRCLIQGVAAGFLMATQSPATWISRPRHVWCSSWLLVLGAGSHSLRDTNAEYVPFFLALMGNLSEKQQFPDPTGLHPRLFPHHHRQATDAQCRSNSAPWLDRSMGWAWMGVGPWGRAVPNYDTCQGHCSSWFRGHKRWTKTMNLLQACGLLEQNSAAAWPTVACMIWIWM